MKHRFFLADVPVMFIISIGLLFLIGQLNHPLNMTSYQKSSTELGEYDGVIIKDGGTAESGTKPEEVFYNGSELEDNGCQFAIKVNKTRNVVTVYTPNSGDGLKRLDYRMEWDKAFSAYLKSLDKPVMACGDFNVANEEIDIKNPKTNHKNAGFTDEERNSFKENLLTYFVDTYRTLYPEKVEYSWWSYRFKAREKNAGWRIDYWLVSPELKDKIVDAKILTDVYGSDHCPVQLDIEV